MARTKRKKSPGVSLLKPQKGSRKGWRIAYTDPDTGKQVRRAIPAHHTRSTDLREDYCVRKSEEIADRKREIDKGATRKSATSIADAVDRWLDRYPDPRTQETYRRGSSLFIEWSRDRGFVTFDDVDEGTLTSFRDDLYTDTLAPATLNKHLRSLSTFLTWAIGSKYTPKLHKDDLSALKKWEVMTELRPYLDSKQVRKAFEAVQRHDDDCHAMTRAEKVEGRRRRRGSTPKFDPLMPLLVLISLTGLRLKEAVQITWDDFDPDKLDASGKVIGEIMVRAIISKTKRARRIPLDHSPALRRYLIQRKLSSTDDTIASLSYDQAAKGLKRIRAIYGCPSTFSWQAMRRTVSTFLTSAPNIFHASAHSKAAKRLGHSWKIAETHYADDIAGISADATTLEDALGIADLIDGAISSGTHPSKIASLSSAR
jgi:integrase